MKGITLWSHSSSHSVFPSTLHALLAVCSTIPIPCLSVRLTHILSNVVCCNDAADVHHKQTNKHSQDEKKERDTPRGVGGARGSQATESSGGFRTPRYVWVWEGVFWGKGGSKCALFVNTCAKRTASSTCKASLAHAGSLLYSLCLKGVLKHSEFHCPTTTYTQAVHKWLSCRSSSSSTTTTDCGCWHSNRSRGWWSWWWWWQQQR